MLLDEIDKVGSDYRGDPAAALLEVLDPAQNHTFRDHYLEVDLDLSDVLFLATANVVETIPSALLDRMELITMDGYTEDDKVAIGRDFLMPRQLERAALTDDEVRLATPRSVRSPRTTPGNPAYASWRGCSPRRSARWRPSCPSPGPRLAIVVDAPTCGTSRSAEVHPGAAERTSVPGVATGLAVTGMGGDVLFIEATAVTAAQPGGAG